MDNITDFIHQKRSVWFKEWFNTSFYHSLYANRSESEAAAFIDNIIEKLQPSPDSSMLDLGCGNGRHSKRLAHHGYNVVGLDLASTSIREAKQMHTPGLQFYEHDMRLPFSVSRFNYVFNLFTSFGYFKTDEENNEVINNISMALKPRGTLVMDYLNVEYSENQLKPGDQKEIDGVVYHITRWHDYTHFYKKIEVDDVLSEGTLTYVEQVQKLTITDFDIMFKRHGLQLKNVYGDYMLGKYDIENSPRLVMVAQKFK